MKKTVFLAIIIAVLTGCSGGKSPQVQKIASKNGFAVLPAVNAGEAVATFAGGCFWATQESMIQLKGVHAVISGYAGGTTVNPGYDEVARQNTGHAEAVQVYYDPSVISFDQLLIAFFYAHNPTQLNRQGPDMGPEYRSIAFYRSPAELKMIAQVIAKMEAKKVYPDRFVTEEEPFIVFYPAESSHQEYYKHNTWDPYIRNVSRPKVRHVIEEMPQLIKTEYLN